MPIRIAVINRSTAVPSADVHRIAAALQQQLDDDYSPVWGTGAALAVEGQADSESWQLVVLDDSDQADALGYHELTKSGRPLGKVFARSVQQSGGEWSVAASHELLEMMADPDINLAAEGFDPENKGEAAFFAYETCDPVEGETYKIGDVSVSDFVHPEYFEVDAAPGRQLDHLKLLKKPFSLRPGGYMSILPIAKGAKWKQIFGEAVASLRAEPKPGGRRERRMRPRHDWRRSTV